MSRNYFISLFISVFFVIYFTSCEHDRFDISTDGVEIHYVSDRFDQDLKNGDFSNIEVLKQSLYQKYDEFYPAFVERIVRIGPADSSKTLATLQYFVEDSTISEIQKDIEDLYNQEKISQIDQELKKAFTRLKYYYPDMKVPQIIYFNSGFNNGIVVLEGQLAIGLDFYLGAENEFIQRLPGDQFQQFKREKMNPEYLIADAIKYWMEVEFEEYSDKKDLLGEIVYKGKILYLTDALLNEEEDRIKMRYFEDELLWAEENEYYVWMEMAKQEVLYGTKPFENKKWIVDGPFTNAGAIPPESPPRLGEFIGWKIIQDYMKDNSEFKVSELMEDGPNQKYLKSYDPRN